MPAHEGEIFSPADVLKRVPLLRRVVGDVVLDQENRRKSRERLEELVVISRKFSSFEIHETIATLRRQVSEYDAALEEYEREIRHLGGILKDPRRGLVYFYSKRGSRRIYLVWDYRQPDLVSWHELDESFADRSPVEFHEGAKASALDSPEV